MKTTRAFIAGLGTSMLLVASSVAMLAVVSAVLAYRGVPGTTPTVSEAALVVKPLERTAEPIQLTRDDIQAANNPEPRRDKGLPSLPGSSGSGASGSSGPSSAGSGPSSIPASSGSNNPGSADAVNDTPQADTPPDPLQTVRDVPNRLRDTVAGFDLGKDGRDLTGKLSDDVVSKVSPKLADDVKKTTEPLWKVLENDGN